MENLKKKQLEEEKVERGTYKNGWFELLKWVLGIIEK